MSGGYDTTHFFISFSVISWQSLVFSIVVVVCTSDPQMSHEQKQNTTVVSFGVLDDCTWKDRQVNGPFHREITDLKHLPKTLREMIHDAIQQRYGDAWDSDDELCDIDEEYVAEKLIENSYFVYNRVNKYYVVAFALNYTRFEIYSKDSDKQLIDWCVDNEKAKNAKIVHQIEDPDYNENPVIQILKDLEVIERDNRSL